MSGWRASTWRRRRRRELLDTAGPFADLPSAQPAISGWVHAYDHARPATGWAQLGAVGAGAYPGTPGSTATAPGKQTDITSETGTSTISNRTSGTLND